MGIRHLDRVVNSGSVELHTSLRLRADMQRPAVLVLDLDPGEGVEVLRCGEAALDAGDSAPSGEAVSR